MTAIPNTSWIRFAGFTLAAFVVMNVQAETLNFSGSLSDPTNSALKSSDLGAASFVSQADIANNVAFYTFSVAAAGAVTFATLDGVGGVDPYFTLFLGQDNAATLAASNYDHAFASGGDFTLPLSLAAGTYTIALGAFANMSFAENHGGTLGDGFVGLGEAYSIGNGFYRIDVDLGSVTPVPEPATVALMMTGLCAIALSRHRNRLNQ